MNAHRYTACTRKRQQGVALIMAMVFLMILTIIGVTVMSTTSLQEKMAGNVQDKNVAFQSAETALVVAENAINASPPGSSLFTAAGTAAGYFLPAVSGDPPIWKDGAVNWADSACGNSGGAICLSDGDQIDTGLVAAQPRYVIENLGSVSTGGSGKSLVVGFTPAPAGSGGATMYRVTALGLGRSNSAVAMVQSVYKR